MADFRRIIFWAIVVLWAFGQESEAQLFAMPQADPEPVVSNENEQPVQQPEEDSVAAAEPQPQAEEFEQEPAEDFIKTPAAFQLKFVGNDVILDDTPKILLYMRNFKIERNLSGGTTCSMRFYVFSNIQEKISNISYRLKWPKIETAISFENVQPNQATYYDYSLLGSGCYTMDKAPNITVNRCRIKGMSQPDCANAIQWLN